MNQQIKELFDQLIKKQKSLTQARHRAYKLEQEISDISNQVDLGTYVHIYDGKTYVIKSDHRHINAVEARGDK